MKNENTVLRFTDEECIVLSGMALRFFERIKKRKIEEEQGKQLPETDPKVVKFGQGIEYCYSILLKDANKMQDETEEDIVTAFGLIQIAINTLGVLEGEELKEVILDKFDNYLMSKPVWINFVGDELADKKKNKKKK